MTTERLRVGIAMDRSLFFITGGYAGVETRASFIDNAGAFGAQNAWRNGGVVGGGVEYAFTNNISAKAEYLYAPMSSQTYFGGTPYAENSGLSMSLARVGLNYKF
jgi:outer membrane immunogenic protein